MQFLFYAIAILFIAICNVYFTISLIVLDCFSLDCIHLNDNIHYQDSFDGVT